MAVRNIKLCTYMWGAPNNGFVLLGSLRLYNKIGGVTG